MAQLTFNGDTLELDTVAAESNALVFLDDSSYEFVGGGDAANGY